MLLRRRVFPDRAKPIPSSRDAKPLASSINYELLDYTRAQLSFNVL